MIYVMCISVVCKGNMSHVRGGGGMVMIYVKFMSVVCIGTCLFITFQHIHYPPPLSVPGGGGDSPLDSGDQHMAISATVSLVEFLCAHLLVVVFSPKL